MNNVQMKGLFKLSKIQRCNASANTKIVFSRLAQELSTEWDEICMEFVLTVKRVIDEAKGTSPSFCELHVELQTKLSVMCAEK